MTDDEMQALHQVTGCLGQPGPSYLRHHRALELASVCSDCLHLLADAVVRQRVERMTADDLGNVVHATKFDPLGPPYRKIEQGLARGKAALLAALTGENA